MYDDYKFITRQELEDMGSLYMMIMSSSDLFFLLDFPVPSLSLFLLLLFSHVFVPSFASTNFSAIFPFHQEWNILLAPISCELTCMGSLWMLSSIARYFHMYVCVCPYIEHAYKLLLETIYMIY